ncbi:hypothetical protein BKA67DRAFT_592987 [Truncatella angustata]|uniref:Uncharacterized protein n=1 Tax=Truncatella angustata TaxID=152316 RepID=A0A9P8ZX82_9PEZI|nr:uncharacterized protein BKA67DRAFT_592987 [Truncatella angustata]KAH6652744.1 hypothetical protein BKA67DRAFT_592987 [Truncatella angustata]
MPLISPPLPIASQYSDKSLLDLRLMHHYCVNTAPGFAGTFPEKVLHALQVEIPALACQHPFLMDAILLVSMVHLCCADSAAFDNMPVYHYRDQALKALRYAVANISQGNVDAVRGASVLLAQVSFATDRVTQQPGLWVTNWMTLTLGQRNFRGPPWSSQDHHGQETYNCRTGRYSSSEGNSVAEIIPPNIHRALARENDGDGPASKTVLHTAATELGRLIAIIQLPYKTSDLEKQVKAWSFDLVPLEFHRLVQQENPKALVILAHYLVIFKLLPDTWLYQDLTNHDIGEIDKLICSDWAPYLSAPRMAIHVHNKEDVIQLLRSSLFHSTREAQ